MKNKDTKQSIPPPPPNSIVRKWTSTPVNLY